MSTPTAARPTSRKDSHWYSIDGQPRYEIIGKTTGKPRAVTLRDAREGNLVPGVTTILKILDKPALNDWKIEQAVMACETTPKLPGEALDAFIERVLHVERIQDQESTIARDKGTEIHNAMEDYFLGQADLIPEDLKPWVIPAAESVAAYGDLVGSEMILVGDGYAGKTDLVLDAPQCWWIWDYKTTKNLPDPKKGGAWSEHRLQLAAYARAYELLLDKQGPKTKPIRTANVYISTVEPGTFVICEHSEWEPTYWEGFAPLVRHWQWANKYKPQIPGMEKAEISILNLGPKPETVSKPEAPKPVPAAPQSPEAKPKGKTLVWTPGTKE